MQFLEKAADTKDNSLRGVESGCKAILVFIFSGNRTKQNRLLSPKPYFSEYSSKAFSLGSCGPSVRRLQRDCMFHGKKLPKEECEQQHLGYDYQVSVTNLSRPKCEDNPSYQENRNFREIQEKGESLSSCSKI